MLGPQHQPKTHRRRPSEQNVSLSDLMSAFETIFEARETRDIDIILAVISKKETGKTSPVNSTIAALQDVIVQFGQLAPSTLMMPTKCLELVP